MTRNHLCIAIVIAMVCSCSKKQKESYIQPTSSSATTDTSTLSTGTSTFTQVTDTFKGAYSSKPPYYNFENSTIVFYVLHKTPDSLHITSNATYLHSNYGNPAPLNVRVKKNDKNAYYVYGDEIVFKKDSIIYSWKYYEEMGKGPSGGSIVTTVHLHGRKTNNRSIKLYH